MQVERELDEFLSSVYSNNEPKIINYLKNHPNIPYNYNYSKLKFPKKVLIEMNNNCNLNCKMCFVESRDNNHLSFNKIAQILKEVKKHRSIVSYSSLEPFMRKDFMKVVKLTHDMKIPFSIVTNGTLIDQTSAEQLIKCKPISVTISLHGTSNVHDNITGKKGSFDLAVSTIKRLLALKKKYHQSLPFIRVNFALSSLNYKNLPQFVNKLSKYGVDIRVGHLRWLNKKHFSQNTSSFKNSLPGYKDYGPGFNNGYNHLDIDILIKILKKLSSKKNITYLPQLKSNEIRAWYSDLDVVRNKKCLYPLESVVVANTGDVYPCAFVRSSYGNIKKSSLSKIWNSKKSRNFKSILLDKGIFPVCMRCCKR